MIIGVKSPEITTLDSPSHGYTPMWLSRMEQWYPYQVRKQMPVANDLVHSRFTPGAFLVHSWCTPGALPVHFRCTPGALSEHSKGFPKGNCFASERKPRSSAQKRLDRFSANLQTRKGNCTASERKPRSSAQKTSGSPFRQFANPKGNCAASERKSRSSAPKRLDCLFANLQTRKGIAPLPKGSLDPLHRNVWIAFSPTCKPERELRRFRKEVSILCTETFGSSFRQLANPKGNCPASERKPRSSAQKRLDRIL